MDYVKGKAQVIVVNDNYKLAPWADILYGCDPKWWDYYEGLEFDGVKVTQDKPTADKYNLVYIESRAEDGLSADSSYINQGQNSGFQALNLAANYGAERIILLGFDMQMSGDKRHWFGSHPPDLDAESKYPGFIKQFNKIKTDVEIINCTRSTALECFPIKKLNEVI